VQHRKLGNTGLSVSAIGFGCWEMGNPEYGSSDNDEMIAAVNRAIDLGVTLFDTAPNYGFGGSEEVLGRALGTRRKDVILVSKVGITWDPVTLTVKFDGRYSTLKRINEESLRRLGTDHRAGDAQEIAGHHNPGRQTASSDRSDDAVRSFAGEQLRCQRTISGDHVRVVVRGYHLRLRILLLQLLDSLRAADRGRIDQLHPRSSASHRVDLHLR